MNPAPFVPAATPSLLISRSRVPRRLAALAAVGLALAMALGPLSARASAFSLGVADDTLFTYGSPDAMAPWLTRTASIGSSYVRMQVAWALIAPSTRRTGFNASDPGDSDYSFQYLDADVRAVSAAGQTIIFEVNEAPAWAEGSGRPANYPFRGVWRPNPSAYGVFAHALAKRYSGTYPDPLHPGRNLPRVHIFQAWNEPNLPQYLSPQWTRANSKAPWQAASPAIYRGLLNAFYAGVKGVQPGATVLGAGTAPFGDPSAVGLGRVEPVPFWRVVFCLTAKCSNPPHLDGIDHHPYGPTPTTPASVAGDVSVPDMWKISAIMSQARRQGDALPNRPKSLWVTEIDWSSTRPAGTAALPGPQREARYLAQTFYELWRQGVSVVCWFELSDPAPGLPAVFPGAGLFTPSGAAKPAATAYRFPFVAMPAGGGQATLWGKAPARGSVAVQMLSAGRWKRIALLSAGADGVFTGKHSLSGHPSLRAVIGRWISPVYTL